MREHFAEQLNDIGDCPNCDDVLVFYMLKKPSGETDMLQIPTTGLDSLGDRYEYINHHGAIPIFKQKDD